MMKRLHGSNRRIGQYVTFSIIIGIAAGAMAQSTLDNPLDEYLQYDLASGILVNNSNAFEVVFADFVSVPDTAWQRVYFDTAELEGESYLRLTSLFDNEVQILDAAALDMWGNTSAYFNGDTLAVELVAAPNTATNEFSIDVVAVQFPQAGVDFDCGICGTDTRQPSNMNHHGRLLPSGCSATIYNTDSCMVTAGHCMSSNLVMEFNVPASASNCALRHPPVADQFPVDNIEGVNGGVGNDWAVATMGTNGQGERPYDRYGLFRPIADVPSNVNDDADVWGYGIDNQCERNQIQQYHGGPIDNRSSSYYDYTIHTTFGNSGSGLNNEDGEVIGVVTHCRENCPNIATRIDLPSFESRRNDVCPTQCFTMSVSNLVAGQNATWSISGAPTFGQGVVVYGFAAGTTVINEQLDYCAVFDIQGINQGRVVGTWRSDGDGNASVTKRIPSGVRGLTIHTQAAARFTCPDRCESNVDIQTVQ